MTGTPAQTIGPFFAFGLEFPGDSTLVPPASPGAIQLRGRVLDGAGEPVPDALIELWQTDASGQVVRKPGSLHRDGHTFTGWGRAATDRTGTYSFTTLPPGAPQLPEGWSGEPPYFCLAVFARGLLRHLFTRAYLPGYSDGVFLGSLEPERRSTLVATADEQGFTFDIRLQGDQQTVFLNYRRPD